LFYAQDKQKKEAAAAASGRPKQSAGELRLQKGARLYVLCYTAAIRCLTLPFRAT
jgi:hypothetical protein